MEPLNISAFWNVLKADQKFKKNALLQCESEIKELLRCVDEALVTERDKWNEERQKLLAKISVLQHEYLIQKGTLNEKYAEIGKLRSALEHLEKQHKESKAIYNEDIVAVKDEAARVRREYQCLQQNCQQQQQRTGILAKSQFDKDESKIKKLNGKIEDFRQRLLEREQETRAVQKQLEAQQLQNKALTSECERLSHDLSSCRLELERRCRVTGSTTSSTSTPDARLSQLHDQLDRAHDSICSQEKTINHLKILLDESTSAQRRAIQEKEQLEQELSSINKIITKLEDEARETHQTIRTQDQLIKTSTKQNVELGRQIELLQHTLRDKENLLQSAHKAETLLREELFDVREQLNCINRQHELQTQAREERNIETTVVKRMRSENVKLRKDLQLVKSSYRFEKAELQKTVAQLNSDLTLQNEELLTLNNKVAMLEQQARRYFDELNQLRANAEVSRVELHALRLENHHLRRNGLFALSDDALPSAEKSESDLQEIRSSYNESVEALKAQNSLLQKELSFVRDELQKMEENTQARIHVAVADKEKLIGQMKDDENRRLFELNRLSRKQLENAETHFRETINLYEAKIDQQQKKLLALEDELDLKNRSLAKLDEENEAMSIFVNGVNNIVTSPVMTKSRLSRAAQTSTEDQPFCPNSKFSSSYEDLNNEDDLLADMTDVIADEFLSRQEINSRGLENKIDFLIEEFAAVTKDATRQGNSPK